MDEKAKPIPILFQKFGATSLFLVQFGYKSPKKFHWLRWNWVSLPVFFYLAIKLLL
jgi:hypothetical protein